MSFYKPLGDNEIRLLHVYPANFQDPLITTLQTVSLKSSPQYVALSYVWGDPNATATITVESAPHDITVNLHSALKHLRHESAVFVIWADALCINQKDLVERNSQVPKMTAVYKEAKEVIAWLGPAADGSDRAMDIMQQVTEAPGTLASFFGRLTMEEARSVGLLLSRPFMARRWIIQEVIIGSVVTMKCGQRTSPFSRFAAWADVLGRYIVNDRGHITDTLHEIMKFGSESNLRDWNILKTHFASHGMVPILEVLRRLVDSECSDPRDRIYGLLGVARDAAFVQPDYTKSERHVFLDFAVRLMLETHSLEVILDASTSQWDDHERLGLPSWVPMWSPNQGGKFDSFEIDLKIPSRPQRAIYFTFSDQHDVLCAKGLVFDDIASVGPLGHMFASYPPQHAPAHQHEHIGSDAKYPTGIPLLQAYFRILLFNKDPKTERKLDQGDAGFFRLAAAFLYCLQSFKSIGLGNIYIFRGLEGIEQDGQGLNYVESYLKWVGQLRGGRTDEEILGQFASPTDGASWPAANWKECSEYVSAYLVAAFGNVGRQAVFFTKAGYMGVAPLNVAFMKGDSIALLAGLGRVAILRQVKGKTKYVGSCFVLGADSAVLYDALEGRRDDIPVADVRIY